MAKPLPKEELDSAVSPAEVAQQTFTVERRGYDQQQVQSYLRAVAESLGDAQRREGEMRTRLGKAVRRAEAAEKVARNAKAVDKDREVGDEVAGVLEAARAAAEQRRAAAEKSAEKLLARAKSEANDIRSKAQGVLDERTQEAEIAAADIIAEGQAEADELLAIAQRDADQLRADAVARIEQVQVECDALISEAEEARGQILEDMERRRRQARAQVERLRVGRDRLLRSYEVVRRTLEETTVELKSSLHEAKVKGDSAARAVAATPAAPREQLEAELADAKLIGRVQISDAPRPANELRSPALPRRLPKEDKQIDPPQVPNIDLRADAAPAARKSAASKKKAIVPESPKAPAVAPKLTPSAKVDVVADGATDEVIEAAREDDVVDLELEQLTDDNLNVVEPSDEIEEVVAVPLAADETSEVAEAEDAAAAERDALADDSAEAEDAADVECDAELAAVADSDVEAVVADSDGDVVTVAESDDAEGAAGGLFAALRDQKTAKPSAKATSAKKPQEEAAEAPMPSATETEVAATDAAAEPAVEVEVEGVAAADLAEQRKAIEAQRDAVVKDAAKQLEKRLKRALADEQNELLASLRGAKRNERLELTEVVGDPDMHVNRYVAAISHVATVTYGAGAALIDAQPEVGTLPAGAVEELLAADIVGPIRDRLALLDAESVDEIEVHIDPVRAFYRQRKNDHLGGAAERLAKLLCVAGVCDSLPPKSEAPWLVAAN